jgi:chromosome segregation ATPase
MSDESTSVLLARLEERLETLFKNQEKEERSKEKLEQTLSGLRDSVQQMEGRLKSVEDSLAKSEPTIEEFTTIKHKVVGAGIFGKWVWAGAGAIIGILAAARREIFAWFAS